MEGALDMESNENARVYGKMTEEDMAKWKAMKEEMERTRKLKRNSFLKGMGTGLLLMFVLMCGAFVGYNV